MWFLIRKCIQKQNSTDVYKCKNVKKQKIKILEKKNNVAEVATTEPEF